MASRTKNALQKSLTVIMSFSLMSMSNIFLECGNHPKSTGFISNVMLVRQNTTLILLPWSSKACRWPGALNLRSRILKLIFSFWQHPLVLTQASM
jgi:hypothetical protein